MWWRAGRFWLIACLAVSGYVSVVFLPPFACEALRIASNGAVAKIVQIALPCAGLGFGAAVGMAGLSFISRRFVSPATHADLARQYERNAELPSSAWGRCEYYFYKAILPPDWPLHRKL